MRFIASQSIGQRLSSVLQLLIKCGGPLTAEDAARLQEFRCLLGTILDACRRLAHLGQA